MRTWLNAVKYYILSWLHLIRQTNGKDPYGRWPGSIDYFIKIPRLSWNKYYARRKELLKKAEMAYKHYQTHLADNIKECPNCGQETYMKVGLTSLYRCYTCNDTPKEWK